MSRDGASKGSANGRSDSDDRTRQIEKLTRINEVLIDRVERSMEHQANAYSLFQTAIGLETQIRARTAELNAAMTRLERLNIELIAARDAAEQANRFKTRFFTAVGHDVLQPLHAARLSLSALSEIDGSAAAASRTGADLFQQIDDALNSVEEMLRTILDISRLEAGAIEPDIRPVALDTLFDALSAAAAHQSRHKNLTFRMRLPRIAVASDRLMLKRILQNLVANAIHYTSSGGILLATRPRGNAVRIEVWDTGPGITREEQSLIFEEFQRGAASSGTRVGGFGLGLSIAQRMAEALGHDLSVCSKPGRGSCFSVAAPRAEGLATEPLLQTSPTAATSYGFAGKQILLIDNDASVQAAMIALLRSWSCAITSCSGIEDLGAIVSDPSFRPDLVIADYHLDFATCGLDGIARLRQVYGATVPAIVVTADHAASTSDNVAAAGCELLLKPVRPAELRALIQHMLG